MIKKNSRTDSRKAAEMTVRYFTIEELADHTSLLITEYPKVHENTSPISTYTTRSEISHGAHGEVYAAKDQSKKSFAIKIVQDTVPQSSSDNIQDISSSIVRNALREAEILNSLRGADNVIGLHSVGYNLQHASDGNRDVTIARIIIVLEAGTRLTLRDFYPLHLFDSCLVHADESSLKRKFSLNTDSLTCVPNISLHSVENRTPYTSLGISVLAVLELSLSVLDVALGLHKESIVHRDFKPENFVFCRSPFEESTGRHILSLYNIYYERNSISKSCELGYDAKRQHVLKLIDFGCAVDFSSISEESSIAGTPQYTSPEIAKRIVNASHAKNQRLTKKDWIWCDTWSIGIVLLEILLGKCHTGLIDGMLEALHKEAKASTAKADVSELQYVASLSSETIPTYTHRCLDAAEKAFQKKN